MNSEKSSRIILEDIVGIQSAGETRLTTVFPHALRERVARSGSKCVTERRNFAQLPRNFSIKRIRGAKISDNWKRAALQCRTRSAPSAVFIKHFYTYGEAAKSGLQNVSLFEISSRNLD